MNPKNNVVPPANVSWLEKCPVCKSGKLSPIAQKKLFGLVKKETVECENCNAIFTQKDDKYQLTKVSNEVNQVWQEYKNQSLTEREWKNIAYG